MAFTPYTPDPNTFHPVIQMPDDAEMQASGIGAYNTPLQQLADNAARGLRWQFDPSWFMKVGDYGDLIDQTTVLGDFRPIKHFSSDVALIIPDCVVGDVLRFEAMVSVGVNSCRGILSIIALDAGGISADLNVATASPGADTAAGNIHSSVSMIGQYVVENSNDIIAQVAFQMILGPGSTARMQIFGGYTLTATRWRAVL